MTDFSAGCRGFEIDDPGGEKIRAVVFYPANAPEKTAALGPFELEMAAEADPADGIFPMVSVSHGTGGSHLLYRTLARHLARSGFVVALVEHPRNNRNNNDLAGTYAILANRPRHLRVAADWAFEQSPFRRNLRPGELAIIGHSLGGYTALAAAGGEPAAFPHETEDGQPRPVEVRPDGRVKALVLLAPATPWFRAPEALRSVKVPILMLTAEKDPHTPAWHGEIVRAGVSDPAQVEHRIVPNAGHYSFLTPFPPAIARPEFPPSQDPEGFDRPAFHARMNTQIRAFLARTIG